MQKLGKHCWAPLNPAQKVIPYRQLSRETRWKPLHRPSVCTGLLWPHWQLCKGNICRDLRERHYFIFSYVVISFGSKPLNFEVHFLSQWSLLQLCSKQYGSYKEHCGAVHGSHQFRIWGSNGPHNEIHLLRKLAPLKKKCFTESQITSKAP